MASTTIKSTYSLDVDTVRRLETIAEQWNVSKSEALRRAIRAAAEQLSPGETQSLHALDRLQSALNLSGTAAGLWEQSAMRERRAAAERLESEGE